MIKNKLSALFFSTIILSGAFISIPNEIMPSSISVSAYSSESEDADWISLSKSSIKLKENESSSIVVYCKNNKKLKYSLSEKGVASIETGKWDDGYCTFKINGISSGTITCKLSCGNNLKMFSIQVIGSDGTKSEGAKDEIEKDSSEKIYASYNGSINKITYSATQNSISLNYAKVEGAYTYRVYQKMNSGNYKRVKCKLTSNKNGGITAKIEGLSAETKYTFMVFPVQKKGESYNEGIGKTVTVSTSEAAESTSDKKREFKAPKAGSSRSDAVKTSGIYDYYEYDDNTYSGKVMYNGKESTIVLCFNEWDELYSYGLTVPMSSYNYKNYLEDEKKNKNKGRKYVNENGQNIWIGNNINKGISYDSDTGKMCLVVIFNDYD